MCCDFLNFEVLQNYVNIKNSKKNSQNSRFREDRENHKFSQNVFWRIC